MNVQVTPEPRIHSINTREGPQRVYGRLLGYSTSESDNHTHSLPFAVKGTRCSACRWFEVYIFETNGEDAQFCVHTVGKTKVPGEIEFQRTSWSDSAYEVVELLFVRQRGETHLPRPSARAIAQAATYNDDIRKAYVNCATAGVAS